MITDEKTKFKPPYVHQDYPRVLYKDAQTKMVANAAEEAAAAELGYGRTPPPPPAAETDEEEVPAAPAPAKGKKTTPKA